MSLQTTISALSNPTRCEIVSLVRKREMAAGEIAARFDLTRPAVSQHLRVLLETGLIRERRVGTKRLYVSRPEGFDELRRFVESFWDLRLSELKRTAEAAERAKKEKPVSQNNEIRREIRIKAAPVTVFALLTDGERMRQWLAPIVEADPKPGGTFRASHPGDVWIEGTYLEIVPNRKVVFTWGGLHGIGPGQSTVEFLLEPDGDHTLLKLRHHRLPPSALEAHYQGWVNSGLPKLQQAAEGHEPDETCPADISGSG